MSVMQIGGVPECVCGCRSLDLDVAGVRPGLIDYQLTCWECGAVMIFRESDPPVMVKSDD